MCGKMKWNQSTVEFKQVQINMNTCAYYILFCYLDLTITLFKHILNLSIF